MSRTAVGKVPGINLSPIGQCRTVSGVARPVALPGNASCGVVSRIRTTENAIPVLVFSAIQFSMIPSFLHLSGFVSSFNWDSPRK